jgi:hypothetical protein
LGWDSADFPVYSAKPDWVHSNPGIALYSWSDSAIFLIFSAKPVPDSRQHHDLFRQTGSDSRQHHNLFRQTRPESRQLLHFFRQTPISSTKKAQEAIPLHFFQPNFMP